MQILTWNTQWCCGMDGVVSVERIVRHALEMGEAAGGLDVLCLQEIAVNYPALQGSPGDQLAELRALLPGWAVFMGASIMHNKQEHFKFTMIADKLTGKKKIALDIFNNLILLTFNLLIFYYGVETVLNFWDYTWVSLPLKMGYVWLCIPIMWFSMSMYTLSHLINKVRQLRTKEAELR